MRMFLLFCWRTIKREIKSTPKDSRNCHARRVIQEQSFLNRRVDSIRKEKKSTVVSLNHHALVKRDPHSNRQHKNPVSPGNGEDRTSGNRVQKQKS